MAAIASARLGVKTLLVEEQGFLGGSLTSMGVGPMMSFHNGAGEQLVLGLPEELISRLKLRGASPGHIPDTTTYCSTVTPFDSEELKIELETGAMYQCHARSFRSVPCYPHRHGHRSGGRSGRRVGLPAKRTSRRSVL